MLVHLSLDHGTETPPLKYPHSYSASSRIDGVVELEPAFISLRESILNGFTLGGGGSLSPLILKGGGGAGLNYPLPN